MRNLSSSYRRSSSRILGGRESSVSRKSKQGRSHRHDNDDEGGNKYLVNDVVAFEEFGKAQDVLKLFQFKDKNRSSDKLKQNVVVKIEVSLSFSWTELS